MFRLSYRYDRCYQESYLCGGRLYRMASYVVLIFALSSVFRISNKQGDNHRERNLKVAITSSKDFNVKVVVSVVVPYYVRVI